VGREISGAHKVISVALDAICGGWDGGGSQKSFDPTDGVEISSLGSSSDGVGGVVVEGVPPIAGGVLGSSTGGVYSLMEISSAAPSPSKWKLNDPKAISKPPVLAEADPVKLAMGSMVVIAGESMVNTEVIGDAISMLVDAVVSMMIGDAVLMSMVDEAMSMSMADEVMSMSMVDEAMSISMADEAMSMVDEAMSISMVDEAMSMSMAIGDAESTAVAGDEPSILGDVVRSAMLGEGAGESIDPDPVIPMVSAN
jgi:hypothetical protein